MTTENTAPPITIVILDPGLSNASGHHFSTAHLLLQTLVTNKEALDIEIMGGSGEWKKQLNNMFPHVLFSEYFCSNFYQYHSSIVPLAELTPHINSLCSEYKAAMVHQLNTRTQVPVFFCHTLDWDHFLALSVAIHQLQQAEPGRVVRCLACLMFSPGLDHQGQIIDKRKYMLAKIALRAAAHLSGLSIFTGHYELMQAIETLGLPQNKKINFHPCLIANWQTIGPSQKNNTNSDINVLLYAGDAKETKGFHLLPSLLKANLHNLRDDIQLTIQFTSTQQLSPVLRNTIDELNAIAAQEKRIVIYNQYLSEPLLAEILNRSDIFFFNYSASHYANMSSGFLWHLAWHKVPMFTFDSSWITREASRLGVESHLIQQRDFCAFINTLMPKASPQRAIETQQSKYEAYYKALYLPPLDWLNEECKRAI